MTTIDFDGRRRVPAEQRQRANGMVVRVMGVSFSITSVLSGLVIGQLGTGWAVGIALALTAAALIHLLTVSIPGDIAAPALASVDAGPALTADFRGAVSAHAPAPTGPARSGNPQ